MTNEQTKTEYTLADVEAARFREIAAQSTKTMQEAEVDIVTLTSMVPGARMTESLPDWRARYMMDFYRGVALLNTAELVYSAKFHAYKTSQEAEAELRRAGVIGAIARVQIWDRVGDNPVNVYDLCCGLRPRALA